MNKLEETFNKIHEKGKWNKGQEETTCGKGSTIENNLKLIEELPIITKKYNIKEIIDIGCGDLNWIRYLFNFFIENGIYYNGLDVSSVIIEKANKNIPKKYCNNIKAQVGEIANFKNQRPKENILAISKDVLVHLPNKLIKDIISEIKQKSKFLLTTNFPETGTNQNIEIGDWRPINLTEKPFNLPSPRKIIPNADNSTKSIFPDKNLSLFELS